MVSVYVDDFLLALNYLNIIDILKEVLGPKYSIKNLGKVQIIIE